MAVTEITIPPTLIDSTAWQYFFNTNKFVGPWPVGADLYAALAIIDGLDLRIEVVKSSDDGATWGRMDDGGGTSILTNGTTPLFVAAAILWFFGGVDPFDTFSPDVEDEQSFDFGTDLFQSLITDDGGSAYSGGMIAALRSDGSAVVTFADSDGAVARIFSAGAFGGKFTIDALASAAPYALIVDSSDVAHVLVVNGASFDYYTITGSGTVAGPVNVADVIEPTDQGVANGGNLYLPFIDNSGLHPRAMFQYASGATSNPADASWNQYPVWAGTLDADSDDATSFAIMDGADVLVFWINTTAAGIARVYYAVFNGSGFDAPVLFYDSSLYPPAGATQDPTMRGLSIANLGGDFVAIAGIDPDGAGKQTYYLMAGSTPPTSEGYSNAVF